jgi:hypothetical protein
LLQLAQAVGDPKAIAVAVKAEIAIVSFILCFLFLCVEG